MLYPSPLRHQSGDIDLWVEGNRGDIYKTLKAKWKVGETVIHHADVEIFKDTLTEIHFNRVLHIVLSFTANTKSFSKGVQLHMCRQAVCQL